MLQYLESITTEPWSSRSVGGLLIAAVDSGHVDVCEWLLTRFPDVLLASIKQWERNATEGGVPLPTVRWAIDHAGVTWRQLAGIAPGVQLQCLHLTEAFSCEAFHWAHDNGLSDCTCPALNDQDEGYEEREEVMEDCDCYQG